MAARKCGAKVYNGDDMIGTVAGRPVRLMSNGYAGVVYNYPINLAAEIAVSIVRAAVKELPSIRTVTLCCFTARDLQTYRTVLGTRTS